MQVHYKITSEIQFQISHAIYKHKETEGIE